MPRSLLSSLPVVALFKGDLRKKQAAQTSASQKALEGPAEFTNS
jgi:hypothetical protein